MAWLVRDTKVLAALDIAESFRDRSRGLLGRNGFDGALLLRPCKSVHTLGMKFPIDVAFCDKNLVVIRTVCLRPGRISRPCLRGHCVVEAEAGAFERWQLRPGDQLEVKGPSGPTEREAQGPSGPTERADTESEE